MHRLRPLFGVLLAWLVRSWAATWRVRAIDHTRLLEPSARAPVVFAFWHGQQLGLVAPRRGRALATLVSWSNDGTLQASVMRSLGLHVVRGSSSRGASAGLRGMLRAVQRGVDVALAVDGPRGPKRVPKRGALMLVQKSGALLIPVASAARHRLVLRRAWDEFEIPLPFTSVVVVLGPPLEAASSRAAAGQLGQAIDRAREQARLEL
jgi:lysophospholipid acyltransferase (LPLAT)-like uncharacterized protein